MGKIADWFGNNWKGLVDTGLSIWNTIQGNKNIDRSLEHQVQENEKTRQHNIMLADRQNAAAIEQWNRENAYNSPAAQKARYEAAGLNADAMYGGIVNTASASPSMVGSAPAQSVDWSSLAGKKTVGDTIDSALDRQYKQAVIDNMNADTKKKGNEASILASDAAFRDAFNRGLLETQNVDIRLKAKNVDLTDVQIKESQSRIRQIDATTEKISTEIQAIVNSIANDNSRLELEKVFNDANIAKLAASANLDKANAMSISKQLEKILQQFDDKHKIDEQQVINLGHEGQILFSESGAAAFEAKIRTREGYDSDMSAWQNTLMFIEQILSAFGSFIHK